MSGAKEVQMLSETRYEHILLNEDHVPMIAGTTIKVIELVLDHLAYGWSPEELHFQHPHLTMGQIHSALAYYWDHKAELDQDIERRLQFVDQVQQTTKPTPLAERLKARRLSYCLLPSTWIIMFHERLRLDSGSVR
jgi:uncharacterized protein (DUF433 family)